MSDQPADAAADPEGSETVTPDDIEKLLAEAQAGVQQASSEPSAEEAKPFEFDNLEPEGEDDEPHPMDLLSDVELDLRIELGRTQMRLDDVLRLRGGAVVALDKLAGDPVDIFVNGRLIARGEVLVMNDNFCVRVTELLGDP